VNADQHEAVFDSANARQGIKGCDAIWPYDPDAAYEGAKKWVETLLADRDRLAAELAEANERAEYHQRLASQQFGYVKELTTERDAALQQVEKLATESAEARGLLAMVKLWPLSTSPIPPEDIARAAKLAKERGWDKLPGTADPLREALRQVDQLREALGAYRSALRSGEPETERLRAVGDAALSGVTEVSA
jgi:hypothetical protein